MLGPGQFAAIVAAACVTAASAAACLAACQPLDAGKREQGESEPSPREPASADPPGARGAVDPSPAKALEPVAEPAIPESRRCGEAGPRPTALPPALATGLERVGAGGSLGPGESKTFGTVVVKYSTDSWIGTREAGHRGEALEVLVDRAEVGNGPWGHQQTLSGNGRFTFWLGPYHVEGSSSMGDPPARVEVSIARRACPDHAVLDDPGAPTWLWVSTDALRAQTLQAKDRAMLQVILTAVDQTPRLELSFAGWRHTSAPVPGRMPSFRAADRTLTIEEVVPGAGTRFTDRWSTDDVAHAHARVRIAPAEPLTIDPAVVATTACGEPGSARTELPSALAATPAKKHDARIAVGGRKTVGPFVLELVGREIEVRGRGPDPERELFRDLVVRSGEPMSPASMTFGGFGGAQFGRAGDFLVRADDDAKTNVVRVRLAELACPRERGIHSLAGPTYVWLSTIGHEVVTLGAGVHARLTAQIYTDDRAPTLGLGSEHANLSLPIAPELVGQAFTMDGELVQVVDVVAGIDSTRESWGWTTTALVPTLHVQLRIAPAE